jgi:hypothetical protein
MLMDKNYMMNRPDLMPTASLYASVGAYGNVALNHVHNSSSTGADPTAKRIGIDVPCFHVGSDDVGTPRPRSGSATAPMTSPLRNKKKSGSGTARNRSKSCVGLSEDGTSLPTTQGIVKSRSYSGVGAARPRSKSTSSKNTSRSSASLSNIDPNTGVSADSYDNKSGGTPSIGYELDVDGDYGLGQDFPIDWLDNVVSGNTSASFGSFGNSAPASNGFAGPQDPMNSFQPMSFTTVHNNGPMGSMHPHASFGMQPNPSNYPFIPQNCFPAAFPDQLALNGQLHLHMGQLQMHSGSHSQYYHNVHNAAPSVKVENGLPQSSHAFSLHNPVHHNPVHLGQHGHGPSNMQQEHPGDHHDNEIQAMAMDLAAWLAVDIHDVHGSQAESKMDSTADGFRATTPQQQTLTMHAHVPRSVSECSMACEQFEHLTVSQLPHDLSPSAISNIPLSSKSTPSPPTVSFYPQQPYATSHMSRPQVPSLAFPPAWNVGGNVHNPMGPGQPSIQCHPQEVRVSPSNKSPATVAGPAVSSPRNFFREPPTLLCDPFSDEAEETFDNDAASSASLSIIVNAHTLANSGSSSAPAKTKRASSGTGKARSNLFPDDSKSPDGQQGSVT